VACIPVGSALPDYVLQEVPSQLAIPGQDGGIPQQAVELLFGERVEGGMVHAL
jgi:hypothetical protein